MSDIKDGDLVFSTESPMIGLVLVARHANWGIWYNLLWEDGTITERWNKFGSTPEIMKYDT